MQEITQHIAITLKALRQARGWSLDRTARETGVSKAMLGQIERNESSPTVATLWKIASGLGVSFSQFLETPAGTEGTLLRHGRESALVEREPGMHVVPLFPFEPDLGFELFAIELAPGALSESAPHARGVVEHVIVIEGRMEVCVEGVWQPLAPGEGLRFAADRAHGYRNRHREPVRFHDVIHYPRRLDV
ncbi:helix-turn-helix domain-containing protein [Modicisalibacter xianhensis]|uniref:Transcriptional regulator, XRE family with cupin sensor n=1 Tax=Modicisalibacter xianhensis TaxID=442341 RepID=A0A1I3FW96_9GAMM|nr:helix-turn-helix domain-containing protein [Halomonas xianhensis]SFI15459.1 transcriptional regulator, XRE family with cupin sensor [Halomonas xianhensis]